MACAKVTPAAPAIRVGIDAPIEEDGGELAAGVVRHLEQEAIPVSRLHASDFLRPRSLRLEFGRDDVAGFKGWYDVAALRREALDHLGPGGDGSWLPRLRDPQTDRSIREHRQQAPPGSIVVLDGRFLLRPGLRGALDLVIHLDVSLAARTRRTTQDDAPLALGAWDHYLAQCHPDELADLVVRFDHPDRPAVMR